MLEQAAAAPGPNRTDEWRADVLAALDELAAGLSEQHATSASEEGLLGKVMRDAQHMSAAVSELREKHREVDERINDLRSRLADYSRSIDVTETRGELAEITSTIRELRAWETDIVYEAYMVDLGVGD